MSVIHATCIALKGTGVLLRGEPGAGKSDLALRLIDAGAELVSDDYCHLHAENGALIATAPPQIAGKMEVRGYGIISLPYRGRVTVGLVIDLTPCEMIPRLPDTTTVCMEGIEIPCVQMDPAAASAAARVRIVVGDVTTSVHTPAKSA